MHILSDTSTTPGLGLNRPNGDERRPDAHRFVGANMAPNRAFGPNEAIRVRTPFVAIWSVQTQPGRCGRVREDMHACSTPQRHGEAVVTNLYLCRIMHVIRVGYITLHKYKFDTTASPCRGGVLHACISSLTCRGSRHNNLEKRWWRFYTYHG